MLPVLLCFRWMFSSLSWGLLFLVYVSCQNDANKSSQPQIHAHGEYLYRLHEEKLFIPPKPEKQTAEIYPWEKNKP